MVKTKKKHVKWLDCSLLLNITLLYRLLLTIVCLTQLMHDENHSSYSSIWSDISAPPPLISDTVIVPYTELHS